jgi:sulfite exporter TauE/SafE
MTWALFSSVFFGALVSGWHCALMCGGLATGVERVLPVHPRRALIAGQCALHLGRLSTYCLLGAVVGGIGSLFWRQAWLPMQRGLFGLAGCLLLWQAARLVSARLPLGMPLSPRFGVIGERLIAPLAHWAHRVQSRIQLKAGGRLGMRLIAGAIWGAVPCGLIYAVLPLAMLSGDAANGALVMLALGLGTLPNMVLISALAARLAQWGHAPWTRGLAALLMGGTGLTVLYRGWHLPASMLQGGLCLTR